MRRIALLAVVFAALAMVGFGAGSGDARLLWDGTMGANASWSDTRSHPPHPPHPTTTTTTSSTTTTATTTAPTTTTGVTTAPTTTAATTTAPVTTTAPTTTTVATTTTAPTTTAATTTTATTTGGNMALGTSLPARLPFSSGGNTYYVDPTSGGDDARSTTQAQVRTTPWQTINHALGAVPLSGSVIKVLPGSYTSSGYSNIPLNWTRAGDVTNPVTLMAETAFTVDIIAGTAGGNTFATWVHSASGLRVTGFNIYGNIVANSSIYETALNIEASDKIEFSGNTFNQIGSCAVGVKGGPAGSGITSDDIWIYGNIFRPSGTNPFAQVTGLNFPTNTYFGTKGSHWVYMGMWGGNPASGWNENNGANRFVVANNVFVGSAAGRHVELGPEARNGFVVNNTFYGNHIFQLLGTGYPSLDATAEWAGSGMEFFANTSQTAFATGNNQVHNNVFVDLDGHGAYGSGPTEAGNYIFTNLSYNLRNGSGYQGDRTQDFLATDSSGGTLFAAGSNIKGDPKFVAPGTYDFHLQTTSPAASAADPIYAPPLDIEGNARDASPSMGAYEGTGGGTGGAPAAGTYTPPVVDGRAMGTASATYPPVSPGYDNSGPSLDMIRWLDSGLFGLYVSVLGFDTSAIPDTATINSATLQLYLTSNEHTDGRYLVGEYFDYGAGVDAADYSSTAPGSPILSKAQTALTTSAYNDLPISDLSGVSKTGTTKLRLTLSGGQPTGRNWVSANSSRGTYAPKLLVDYHDGGCSGEHDLPDHDRPDLYGDCGLAHGDKRPRPGSYPDSDRDDQDRLRIAAGRHAAGLHRRLGLHA